MTRDTTLSLENGATTRAPGAAAGAAGELPHLEHANRRLLAEARVLFAAVALLMSVFERPGVHPPLLALILIPYAVYGATQMWRLGRGATAGNAAAAHWIDVAAYTLVVTFSGGLESEFFVFLLFPVLAASLQWGFSQGVAVTVVCALLFAGSEGLRHWLSPELAWTDLSLRPVIVLVLAGLAVSRWGNAEATLMRRLALSNDLSGLVSPSYGIDHAIYRLAELLRTYQRADSCIVVLQDPKSAGRLLYQVDEGYLRLVHGRYIDPELAGALPDLPADTALLYSAQRWPWRRAYCAAYDPVTLEPQPVDREKLAELANLLEANSFISLPVRSRNQTIGRVHLASRKLCYTRGDIRFMAQVSVQVGLLIENMRLLDKLFLEAAAQERRRISLDLHDGTIQPYIGLKLGLEALRRKLSAGDPAAGDVEDLTRKAADGIDELRRYVGGLRGREAPGEGDSLLSALRGQAQKFSEFYGLRVDVAAEHDLVVTVGVLKEIKHIVHEALSNVRRHTAAQRALVHLCSHDGRLVLEVINDRSATGQGDGGFYPRSIGERVKELGGNVTVERRPGGHTAVQVELPA